MIKKLINKWNSLTQVSRERWLGVAIALPSFVLVLVDVIKRSL